MLRLDTFDFYAWAAMQKRFVEFDAILAILCQCLCLKDVVPYEIWKFGDTWLPVINDWIKIKHSRKE